MATIVHHKAKMCIFLELIDIYTDQEMDSTNLRIFFHLTLFLRLPKVKVTSQGQGQFKKLYKIEQIYRNISSISNQNLIFLGKL